MGYEDIEKESKKPAPRAEDFFGGNEKKLSSGLYLVATPIGNLRDITLRALDTLRSVDLVLCEDTRVSGKLFSAYGLKAKLLSFNDHTEDKKQAEIFLKLEEGASIAVVSDAGMPLISDPGYKLVRDARSRGFLVTSVPGANAPLSALQLSGLPSDQFCFLGFLPNKTKARQDFLRPWSNVTATLIAFETAPRLIAALKDIAAVLGADREVAVVREITKLFEETRRDKVMNLAKYYEEEGLPKGEIVLVIEGFKQEIITQGDIDALLINALGAMRTKDAAAYVADQTNTPKKELYERALFLLKEQKK